MSNVHGRLSAPSSQIVARLENRSGKTVQDVFTCPQRSDFRKISPTMKRLLLLMGLLGFSTT